MRKMILFLQSINVYSKETFDQVVTDHHAGRKLMALLLTDAEGFETDVPPWHKKFWLRCSPVGKCSAFSPPLPPTKKHKPAKRRVAEAIFGKYSWKRGVSWARTPQNSRLNWEVLQEKTPSVRCTKSVSRNWHVYCRESSTDANVSSQRYELPSTFSKVVRPKTGNQDEIKLCVQSVLQVGVNHLNRRTYEQAYSWFSVWHHSCWTLHEKALL